MSPKPIPATLPGTVHAQYVRFGNRGELHGPYWFRFWRDERGRVRKEYVKHADLETVQAACAARQTEERAILETLVEGAEVVAWFLGGAARGSVDEDVQRLVAFPRLLRQLTKLAAGSHLKPQVSIQAFNILEPLWAHHRQQETAETNRRLLLGDRLADAGIFSPGLLDHRTGQVFAERWRKGIRCL